MNFNEWYEKYILDTSPNKQFNFNDMKAAFDAGYNQNYYGKPAIYRYIVVLPHDYSSASVAFCCTKEEAEQVKRAEVELNNLNPSHIRIQKVQI